MQNIYLKALIALLSCYFISLFRSLFVWPRVWCVVGFFFSNNVNLFWSNRGALDEVSKYFLLKNL